MIFHSTMHQKHHNAHNHKHDHTAHHRMMIKDFKRRFWVCLVLSLPVIVLSPTISDILGIDLAFEGSTYVLFGLSSIIFLYGGWPFLKGMRDELKEKAPGMMTLIAVAIVVAYAYSVSVVFGLPGKMFFWELATLIVIMLLGHWIEMRSVLGASNALEKLSQLMPDTAHLVEGEAVTDVKIDQLHDGQIILIKPGEKIPADATITEGRSDINESMLTGESTPVDKKKGDEVIGGSINGSGAIKAKIKSTGTDTYLSKVIKMVRDAQGKKSRTQKLADKAAFWLTVVALSAGGITLAAWLIAGREFSFALERMVTVMVISCPHALGLAIPLVAAISTSISAKHGLLIRNRTAFENSRKITTLVFDKTGTLTTGEFGVNRIESVNSGFDSNEVLRLAAAIEANSEHPIGRGILDEANELNIEIPEVSNFKAITGTGVEGTIESKQVLVVSPGYLKENSIDIPDTSSESGAETVVYVLVDKILVGFIALSDRVRPESKEAISTLHNNNIKIVMLTGDNEKVARAVCEELNIDEYRAQVSPEGKLNEIQRMQESGEFVAMTGDGVNDAPALAKANIGIAIGSGTDVAAETADIILVESDPKDIVSLILFGKATYRKMIQNLIWATAYNVIAIPLAAGALFFAGVLISPAVGAALMSLSTVIVAINAQLLRKQIQVE